MIKLGAPAGLKDDIEMRKVYAGFVAGQIEAGSPLLRFIDLMEPTGDGAWQRDYPQQVIVTAVLWEANAIGTAAGWR